MAEKTECDKWLDTLTDAQPVFAKEQAELNRVLAEARVEDPIGVHLTELQLESAASTPVEQERDGFADLLPLTAVRIAPGEYEVKSRDGRALWRMEGAALADWVCASVSGYDAALRIAGVSPSPSVREAAEDPHWHIDEFWKMVHRCWEIEPREYFEREAPRNGFGSPLAMAVHYMWKREVKPVVSAAGGDEDQCPWTLDDSNDGDLWETGCGEAFRFTDGGPTDNGFTFCYKCGKRISAGRYSDDGADSVGEEGK